jgi:hypothetical protein
MKIQPIQENVAPPPIGFVSQWTNMSFVGFANNRKQRRNGMGRGDRCGLEKEKILTVKRAPTTE